jgi:nucleotide-binding universal stress UspA family protein
MSSLLVAVDGSPSSLAAVGFALQTLARRGQTGELHLLNVQPPLPEAAAGFLSTETLEGYHREQGEKALKPALDLAQAEGRKPHAHILVGDPAQVIAESAKRWSCDQIVMGHRGLGGIQGLLLGSVTGRVLHLAHVPVTVVR